MTEKFNQYQYLHAAKDALGVEWDEFAERIGIKSRRFKTYRMPDTSHDYRPMPDLVKREIDRLLETKGGKKSVAVPNGQAGVEAAKNFQALKQVAAAKGAAILDSEWIPMTTGNRNPEYQIQCVGCGATSTVSYRSLYKLKTTWCEACPPKDSTG